MPHQSLAERLLAEMICLREEAAGHPAASPAADAAAIAAGGDLMQRIHARAQAMPAAVALRAGIDRVLRIGRALAVALLILFAVIGVGGASAALGATRPANLPLVLLAIVATNVLTFLGWLLLQPFSRQIGISLGSMLRALWVHLAALKTEAANPAREAIQLIGSGAIGRWLLGSVVHAAWLAFGLAGLLTLAVLLSLRSYELSWETTLLNTDALAAWARALSWAPAVLGLSATDTLSVTDTSSAVARQSWAHWLLMAVLVYGVLPRAIALGVCGLMLRRALAPLGCEVGRPGFARLRARLMPDHRSLGVTDAAPEACAETAAATPAVIPVFPTGTVHGLALEGLATDRPPTLPGVDWIWLGSVDDAASRGLALQRLRDGPIVALAIIVRATLSPDRGIERFVAELVSVARAPTLLILGQYDRLELRGADVCRERLADWRELARRANVGCGVMHWRGESSGNAVVSMAESTP